MKTTSRILVIDLEATCWAGHTPENQTSEIIEIGICILDTSSGCITRNEGILIKPTLSEVSEFCTELTTITPEMLEQQGVSFSIACETLRSMQDNQALTWASYGAYDKNMVKRQCAQMDIRYPLSEDHINVKELFAQQKNLNRKVGMNGALQILDIPLEGTHHRGVDDAKNIAKILCWCLNVDGKT